MSTRLESSAKLKFAGVTAGLTLTASFGVIDDTLFSEDCMMQNRRSKRYPVKGRSDAGWAGVHQPCDSSLSPASCMKVSCSPARTCPSRAGASATPKVGSPGEYTRTSVEQPTPREPLNETGNEGNIRPGKEDHEHCQESEVGSWIDPAHFMADAKTTHANLPRAPGAIV